MAIYDLMLKLEGMKALCGDGVTDDTISRNLFPTHEVSEQRSSLSRLKSGQLELGARQRSILTEDFNARINKSVVPPGNDDVADAALLRSDDWERPLPEFFARLALTLEVNAGIALARAHAAILAALHGLQDYRERDHALLIASYDAGDAEAYRFPDKAAPIDPLELPLSRVVPGKPMIASMVREVSEEPARGWLFFIRNPDERQGLSQSHYIWDQDLTQMLFWQTGGPFSLPANHIGALPGYPTKATNLAGEVTAFLLVEPMNSTAIADLLRTPQPDWDGVSAPSFESVAHLVTCGMRLFQRGNARSFRRGQIAYHPPKLFVRRYRVAAA